MPGVFGVIGAIGAGAGGVIKNLTGRGDKGEKDDGAVSTPRGGETAPAEVPSPLWEHQKVDTIDGNQAATHIAYAFSDTSFIYPITPSSTMGELAELWAGQGLKNIFGQTVSVVEMQSEGGAAGAVHGSLASGALNTTFTASQGLLLMIPNMFKIAGELMPCVFHVSARALAGAALCIFGDHSDVMAVRQTGWALLSSHTVQESHDMALVAHLSTLDASVPFIHFFDGFRTSHEVNKIKTLDYDVIRDEVMATKKAAIDRHRARALNPAHPQIRGTAQSPDIFFQMQEAANKYYEAVPEIVAKNMEVVYKMTGRRYTLFGYEGHPQPEHVVVMMGSSTSVVVETARYLNEKGRKCGVLKVHLYRPWSAEHFMAALPKSAKVICVLDRTKEQGALGEPLYLDVASTMQQAGDVRKCFGGRYGLGSKEFTPAMAKAVFDNMNLPLNEMKTHFTVGILDDVTHKSLALGPDFTSVPPGTRQCMFWGMGSDGTVGANKEAIKLIGMNTDLYAQGYFAYDAHKSGGVTVSHLRFGPHPINSAYLVTDADYIACHKQSWVDKYDVLKHANDGSVFLLNCVWSTPEEFDRYLPAQLKRRLARKNIKFYAVDANKIAEKVGLGKRVNMCLQACFFRLSEVMPYEDAIKLLKKSIKKVYGKKGDDVVNQNYEAVDQACDGLIKVNVPDEWKNAVEKDGHSKLLESAPAFVCNVMMPMARLEGDALPVSSFEPGGLFPVGTTKYEKRAIATNVPVWDGDKCTQCNHCALVCPHAAIRPFLVDEAEDGPVPAEFETKKLRGNDLAPSVAAKYKFRIQVSPLDCTGCNICAVACPDEALTMMPIDNIKDRESRNWDFAEKLPIHGDLWDKSTVKGSQFQQPLLEFSGACEGCGETPYVKLLTQLFGDRMVIANATGCSSIWGGTASVAPYTVNQKGRGPAWGNSLFEDNAEYGFGITIGHLQRRKRLLEEVKTARKEVTSISPELAAAMDKWVEHFDDNEGSSKISDALIAVLEPEKSKDPKLEEIYGNRDLLPKLSHWILGGDGWAYDIGFGGLDHILASGEDVNIFVMDTEVYSNTGGQSSKATPMGAVAKFSSAGKRRSKKDLGLMAMQYGNVYVASICIGANYSQVVRAFVEAEAYPGTSLIIGFAQCAEHNPDKGLKNMVEDGKLMVDSGYWTLYRFNPVLEEHGINPFTLDSRRIKVELKEFLEKQGRFKTLKRLKPEVAQQLQNDLLKFTTKRHALLKMKAADPAELTKSSKAGDAGVLVLYGSETGNAEELAKRFGKDMKARGMSVRVMELDEYELEELANEPLVIIFCSTAGQGELPQNATFFHKEMSKSTKPANWLENVSYSVFGLGDSNYLYFNKAAEMIGAQFARFGAKCVQDMGYGDDQAEDKYETAYEVWIEELMPAIKAPPPPKAAGPPEPSLFVSVLPAEEGINDKKSPNAPSGGFVEGMDVTLLPVTQNKRITHPDYDRHIMHLVFDLTGTGFSYNIGDALAIHAHNDEGKVREFLQFYELNPDEVVTVASLPTARGEKASKPRYPPHMSVLQLFTQVLDLFGRPTKRFYESLLLHAKGDDVAKLEKLLSPAGALEYRNLRAETLTFADLLRMFPNSHPDIPHLLDMIPRIKPRYYSIASSPRVDPNKLDLCVVLVDWKTPGGKYRTGLTTTYLKGQDVAKGPVTIACSLKAAVVGMPETNDKPLIMAGLGTGLAPFRSMIQDRAILARQGQQVGPMVLYFGCRFRAQDYLFGDELEAYHKEGVLTHLRVAFSRDQAKKVYIQNKIEEDPELLYDMLIKKEGFFYLCGPSRGVPEDIRKAVNKSLQHCEGISEEEAEAKVNQLQLHHRYNVEAWS
eukprot:jgi/Mesvir1/537/Mv11395-RA.1